MSVILGVKRSQVILGPREAVGYTNEVKIRSKGKKDGDKFGLLKDYVAHLKLIL